MQVDAGETPEAALCRELAEELGIAVEPAELRPCGFVSFPYPAFHLLMPLFGGWSILQSCWTPLMRLVLSHSIPEACR
jgi:8-oxo-dGTP pyrophosphatase MutT (NUDIX family)